MMSSKPLCTPAEIAEKKRIAEERLKMSREKRKQACKQANQYENRTSGNRLPIHTTPSNPRPASLSIEEKAKIEIAEKKRIAEERLKITREKLKQANQYAKQTSGNCQLIHTTPSNPRPASLSIEEKAKIEIAEKKRIAEERLKITREKLKQANQTSGNCLPIHTTPPIPRPASLSVEEKAKIEKNRLAALALAKKNKLISAQMAADLASRKISPGKAPGPSKYAITQNRMQPYLKPQNREPQSSSHSTTMVNKTVNQNPPPGLTPNFFDETRGLTTRPTYVPMQESFLNAVIVQMEMISEFRFVAKLNKKSDTVLNEFRKIASRNYNDKEREWSFNISDYEHLLKVLADIKSCSVNVETIPTYSMTYIRCVTEAINESCLELIEPVLVATLLPFQRKGVCFGIARGGRFLLADDMGLGKTRQALAVADYFKKDWPLLIVSPATVRDVWHREILDLLPQVNVQNICVVKTKQDIFFDAKIVITSYALLDNENFMKNHFNMVIFDESHNIKNPKAKQTIIATQLGQKAIRVILLTGTPALSRPVEMYSQVSIIDRMFMAAKSFTKRYCDGHNDKFGWNDKGSSNLRELNVILLKNFMIRRTMGEVYMELGVRKRNKVELKGIKISRQQHFLEDYNGAEGKKKVQREILLEWFVETAELKKEAVCHYIEEKLKENNEKILIFAVHISMMDSISNVLANNCIPFVRIDGSTNQNTRTSNIAMFQNDPEVRVAVLSIGACATGVTLTSASTVIFAELYWTPAILLQCEGRSHRIGQEREVTCYYLIAPNSADVVIWDMLQQKQQNLKQVGLVANDQHLSQYTTTTFNVSAGQSTFGINPRNSRITDFYSPNSSTTDSFHTCQSSLNDVPASEDQKAAEETKAVDYLDDDFVFNEDDLNWSQELKLNNVLQQDIDDKIAEEIAAFINS